MQRLQGECAVADSIVFFAGLIVVACSVLGGLYFLFRQAKSSHDKWTRRKPPLAGWK
jgi:hypothetical protein